MKLPQSQITCKYCLQRIEWRKEPIGGGFLPYGLDGKRHQCDEFYNAKEATPEIAMSRLAVAVNRLADILDNCDWMRDLQQEAWARRESQ